MGTNLEALELDLSQVSHGGGTGLDLSLNTDSLEVWDPILVTHTSGSGALYRVFRGPYTEELK